MRKIIKLIALILVIVGGLNWGLVGFFGFNLVETLFGTGMITTIVYDLVGISAVLLIIFKFVMKGMNKEMKK